MRKTAVTASNAHVGQGQAGQNGGRGERGEVEEGALGTARTMPVRPHTEPHSMIASSTTTGCSPAPPPMTIGSSTSFETMPEKRGKKNAAAICRVLEEGSSAIMGIGRQTAENIPMFGMKLSQKESSPNTSQSSGEKGRGGG